MLEAFNKCAKKIQVLLKSRKYRDMLPQQLVYKNELNLEYVLTLARKDGTP